MTSGIRYNKVPATANRDGRRREERKENEESMDQDYSTIFGLKKQGIIFNPELERWEYYGCEPVVRGGEPQPEFVSVDYDKCITYEMTVEVEK